MPKDHHTTDQPDPLPPLTEPNGSPDVLQIETIVAGGDGMARRPDGCVVFVPRTARGERVEVEYVEEHRQWRRARIRRVLEESPDRHEPPCPYYASCGGCQLQHLDYHASQLPAKAAIISESFRRIGKVEVPPPEVSASEREFGYRNRVSFVVFRRDAATAAGYHNVYDPSDLVDIDECLLAEKPINDVWAALRASWDRATECLPSGDELRLTFRANSDQDVGLAIEGGRDAGDPNGLLELADRLVAIWALNRRGDIVGGAGVESLDERIGPYVIPLVGTGFVQVNRGVAASLDEYVREQCGDLLGKRIVDAYCGFGLRTLDIARGGALTVGIERDGHAVQISKQLAEQTATPVRFMAGDVERLLKRSLPADVVILNPPRRGVARPVIDALAEGDVARVIYVSCDPATLARDLHRLSTQFMLGAVRGFDLFPQTAHVETVATLTRIGLD